MLQDVVFMAETTVPVVLPLRCKAHQETIEATLPDLLTIGLRQAETVQRHPETIELTERLEHTGTTYPTEESLALTKIETIEPVEAQEQHQGLIVRPEMVP